MQEIFDPYCWEEHKKVIPFKQHRIPGLGNFAYWNLSKATTPAPLHHHSDIVEMHCLIKGKRVCQVGDDTYTVTGNELFLTFPFEAHSTESYHLSPCSFYGIQIDLKDREHLLGLNREYSLALYEILSTLELRHFRYTPQEQRLLKLAFENISDGDPGALQLGVQYLSCFLFKIPEFIPIRQTEKKIFDENIKRVLEYIDMHYREALPLQELSVLSGYSLSRFKIKFKEEVGVTPAYYIIYKKLEYAKKLLETTDISITQIAMDAGFSSSNYFGTVLRKYTSSTPSEYRKLSRSSTQSK